MQSNIIRAVFGAQRRVRTRALTRQDFGVILQFVAAELPDTFQVHFANTDQNTGTAKTAIGTRNDGVIIPQEFLQTGKTVYAWVFIQSGDSGVSRYVAEIPVDSKPTVSDAPPTPEQRTALDEAIERLNVDADIMESINFYIDGNGDLHYKRLAKEE